jgi:hypothetical protein
MTLRIARHPVALVACLAFCLGRGFTSRVLHATASGCTRFDNSAPRQESLTTPAECVAQGGGCYQCGYTNTGEEGYTLCAENPDGSGALCGVFDQLPDDWPQPDTPDPDPGEPPPDAPPPDSPGDGGGDGGGGGGGGECLPPECHEADLLFRLAATSAQRHPPATNLWLSLAAVPFRQ